MGPGNYHILGHAGFGGGPGVPNTAMAKLRYRLFKPAPDGRNHLVVAADHSRGPAEPYGSRATAFICGPRLHDGLPGGTKYTIVYEVEFLFPSPPPPTNYEFPPALFGVRLLRP